jgi:hypothetical protein
MSAIAKNILGTIGETPLDVTTFQGINRTSWNLLKSMFSMREITLTVIFEGPDLREAKRNRSALNGVLFDKVDLFIPDDGFYYDVYCTGTGAETLIGIGSKTAQIKSDYHFKGIRHDALQTVTLPAGDTLYCRSTAPVTDCRLTATVGTSGSNYQLGGAVFATVTAGDVLVFDGIDGKITRNGVNAAASVVWVNFPQLVPGPNVIDCDDDVTVQYAPTYI